MSKESNTFMLDDGTREIKLENPFHQTICTLHIRVGDISIVDRYKAVAKELTEEIKSLGDIALMGDSDADHEESWRRLKEIERKAIEKVNDLFDTEDAGKIFERRNAFSSVDGEFFIEKVLTTLGQVVQKSVDEEAEKAKARTEKYLSDVN